MKARVITGVLLLVAAARAPGTVPAEISFDRYQGILDRKPFGALPATDNVVAPQPQAESFAKSLRLSTIIEMDDGSMKIGFIDTRNGKSFMMRPGEEMEGYEVVSGSWADEEAVLRQGEEMALIKLASGAVEAITPADQQRRQAEAPRTDYTARRRQRTQESPEPPVPSKYTGAALEKHLQEYQMEVIRQGLPPLPIPLTPEMDRKLIEEGVLPPQ